MDDPKIDPTKNVLDLVAAAIQRQDDLREAAERHVKDMAGLRAHYDERLRIAETARLDAIRSVDASAVQRESEVQAAAAATLAAQLVASAEAMRVALSAALVPIQADVADLRRSQYEAAGVRNQATESGGTGRERLGLAIAAAAVGSSAFLGLAAIAVTLLLR